MSDDDFEFDDDEDFELDESGVDDEPEFDDADEDAGSEAAAPEKPAKAAKPYDPNAKVPFFKNWVWWTSLIAAVPAGFLLVELFNGFVGLSESLNLMWTITMIITALCAVAAVALPLLIALRVGKFLGGDVVTVAPGVAGAAAPSGSKPEKSDIAATPEDFDDDEQDLFDSEDGLPELQDSEVFGDDDDDFDDDEF